MSGGRRVAPPAGGPPPVSTMPRPGSKERTIPARGGADRREAAAASRATLAARPTPLAVHA